MASTGDSDLLPAVCLPVALEAFVLNPAVCDEGPSFITPIVQPNYVSLRLDNSQIQHDILPHIDLLNAKPASANPRISRTWSAPLRPLQPADPSPPPGSLTEIDRSRLGVYLHWSIPRGYRSGASAAAKASESATAKQRSDDEEPTQQNPVFPLVPNRWLVVRVLRDFEPQSDSVAKASAWVIESDKVRKIDELDDSVDLLTDVTPFVSYAGDAESNEDILNNQAEIYIGYRKPLSDWKESHSKDDRVPLSVMNSSNPLFADYALHNPNVFSTKDNLQYGVDQHNQPLYLTSATCDYAVFGWHSDPNVDPLSALKNKDLQFQLQTRLKNFSLVAQPNADGKGDIESTDSSNIGRHESKSGTRLFCHSARYGVRFTVDQKPAAPADDFAKLFSPDVPMEPVSVGTSPLDAVLAFLQAHQSDTEFEDTLFKEQDPEPPSDSAAAATAQPAPSAVAQALMGMRELLYSTEDDYDAKTKAADLIYAHNFTGAAGGFAWHYDRKKEKDGPPLEPSPTEKQQLIQLNEQQRVWDANQGKLRQLRWALFAEFFKYVSDPSNTSQDRAEETSTERFQLYASRVPSLRREIDDLTAQQGILEKLMCERTVPARKVAKDAFFKRMDPTLCLAGLDDGWDADFLQSTKTRFFLKDSDGSSSSSSNNGSLIQGPGPADSQPVQPILDLVSKQLDSDISPTVLGLLREASGGWQTSLAHYGHKQWTHQPFSPQFVEWEGTYYHVPWDRWKVDLAKSAVAASNHTHVTYVNDVELAKQPGITGDRRHISGRMLVLPQPSFALGAVVSQVLDTIPVDPDSTPTTDARAGFNLKNKEDRDSFQAGVKKLRFVSGELSGLTDALLTMATGQHVKPNVRVQGEKKVIPMKAAEIAGENIGLVHDDFVRMDGETGRTPYGTMTDFANETYPFKPVQHGQFAITRLTIVDKFGQAVCYPAPSRALRDESQAALDVAKYIHPCLDEQLLPSLFGDTMNTVFTPQDTQDKISNTSSGYPMTPFLQLTPAINQEARINAAFLQKTTTPNGGSLAWTPCSDWENPIFGWIVVNYADSALQFFTGEGIFYTSLQFGGPTGTIKTKDWLPFDPPATPEGIVSDQLDALIKKMQAPGEAGRAYLLALWDLIRRAIPTMPFPPSDYAQFANAIVGKPLALVNVGWSLELAQPAWWRQHTLPPPNIVPENQPDYLRDEAGLYLCSGKNYNFPVKIGDADRPFDGVVAYWKSDNKPALTTHFDDIYTYFPADEDDGLRKNIVPESYPTLMPYYLHSDPTKNPTGAAYAQAHVDKFMVTTVLMDPYTPIHLYSGILPIKKLELPPWSLRGAMKNMTTFFTMGPLLLTKDVPKLYDLTKQLHPDSWLVGQAQDNPAAKNTKPVIHLPISGSKGMWNWLQPYRTEEKKDPADTTGTTTTPTAITTPPELVTRFNALEVGKEDGKLRKDPGPYTFVGGFLQLARPIIAPKADTSTL